MKKQSLKLTYKLFILAGLILGSFFFVKNNALAYTPLYQGIYTDSSDTLDVGSLVHQTLGTGLTGKLNTVSLFLSRESPYGNVTVFLYCFDDDAYTTPCSGDNTSAKSIATEITGSAQIYTFPMLTTTTPYLEPIYLSATKYYTIQLNNAAGTRIYGSNADVYSYGQVFSTGSDLADLLDIFFQVSHGSQYGVDVYFQNPPHADGAWIYDFDNFSICASVDFLTLPAQEGNFLNFNIGYGTYVEPDYVYSDDNLIPLAAFDGSGYTCFNIPKQHDLTTEAHHFALVTILDDQDQPLVSSQDWFFYLKPSSTHTAFPAPLNTTPLPDESNTCTSGGFFDLSYYICLLFMPSQTTLNGFSEVFNGLSDKPPFGYISLVVSVFNDFGGGNQSVNDFDFLDNSPLTTLILDPFKTILSIIFYCALIFFVFNRLRHFNFQE